ncbi:single-stranded DNA-binding protein [Gilvimarinus sp. 1_MG-2023]|uniref:single-stranded DNA-binding protein n=1 Tax=Gilvimarinus sp. 1_MG-2023 TaxID=3062638 RepID=UPI0026E46957|nr:single-stranded DNA-binding protein [Gilvimarinus sp. 1_MG-2023]MDO6747198.1 single-stranded DNA-binding protein [Gilvimarinus sp. 1_MG-2023]
MLSELCRLGADAELKYTPDQTPVAELRLAYDVRVKGETRTQWITASLWGKRAENTAPYLTKGKQLFVTMESPYVRKWDNGEGVSVMSRVIDFKFAGGQQDQGGQGYQAPAQDYRGHSGSNQPNPTYQQGQPAQQQQPAPQGGFDSFDDDIPFDIAYRGMGLVV